MSSFPFADYLSNDKSYSACVRFWSRLIRRAAQSAGQTDAWSRWADKYADGTSFPRDGNPIYAARSEELNRGLRVMQHPPATDSVEIVAWIKDYPAGYEVPESELVINLSLSEESAHRAEVLIRLWSMNEILRDGVEAMIADIARPPA